MPLALAPVQSNAPDMVRVRRPGHLCNGGPTEAECLREHIESWRRNGFEEVHDDGDI